MNWISNEQNSASGVLHGFLAGSGEMARRMREHDWPKTALGPVAGWSAALKTMTSILLANRVPMLLWWGPDSISIYNDAYIPLLGSKHPTALGAHLQECWAETYDVLRPLILTPLRQGAPTWSEDELLEIRRHGFVEETHWNIAYSPVPDDTVAGGIGGVLAAAREITAQVVGTRRTALLESEKKFRALVTASSDVVYRMSPDWSEMRHLVGRDFIADTTDPSRSWLEKYIHPDDQPRVLEVIAEAIRSKTTFELEHRVLRVDGTLGWTHSKAIPLTGEGGDVVEWVGTANDVTARRQAQDALKRDLDAMTRLQKLGSCFARDGSLDPVFEEIVGAAVSISGADAGSIQALDDEGSALRLAGHQGLGAAWLLEWSSHLAVTGYCRDALARPGHATRQPCGRAARRDLHVLPDSHAPRRTRAQASRSARASSRRHSRALPLRSLLAPRQRAAGRGGSQQERLSRDAVA